MDFLFISFGFSIIELWTWHFFRYCSSRPTWEEVFKMLRLRKYSMGFDAWWLKLKISIIRPAACRISPKFVLIKKNLARTVEIFCSIIIRFYGTEHFLGFAPHALYERGFKRLRLSQYGMYWDVWWLELQISIIHEVLHSFFSKLVFPKSSS